MSAVLFSAVSFDPLTSLYTYNYAVQNNSNSTIWELGLLVGSPAIGTPLDTPYTAPPDWTMFGAVSNPPLFNSELGALYEWSNGVPATYIQPHTDAFGFSLTTRFAPTLDNGENNYFLYGSEGFITIGNIAVPSGADWLPFTPPGVPEPSTWLMLLIGFVALSAARRRLTVQPHRLSS